MSQKKQCRCTYKMPDGSRSRCAIYTYTQKQVCVYCKDCTHRKLVKMKPKRTPVLV